MLVRQWDSNYLNEAVYYVYMYYIKLKNIMLAYSTAQFLPNSNPVYFRCGKCL